MRLLWTSSGGVYDDQVRHYMEEQAHWYRWWIAHMRVEEDGLMSVISSRLSRVVAKVRNEKGICRTRLYELSGPEHVFCVMREGQFC